jgi:hypothetical protein
VDKSIKIIGYLDTDATEVIIPHIIDNIPVNSIRLDDLRWKKLENIILHENIKYIEYKGQRLGGVDNIIIDNNKYLLMKTGSTLPTYIIIHRYGLFKFLDESFYYSERKNYRKKLYYCRVGNKIAVTGASIGEKHLIIPDIINGLEVTIITENAFMNHDIKTIKLPRFLKLIEERAFKNNNISRLLLTKDISIIKTEAFMNNNITHVGFSKNVKKIGSKAFANNSIRYARLPISLIQIELDAFKNSIIEENFLEIKDLLKENYIHFKEIENLKKSKKNNLGFNLFTWGTTIEEILGNGDIPSLELDTTLTYEKEIFEYESQVTYWFRYNELYKIDVSLSSNERYEYLEEEFLETFYKIFGVLNRVCLTTSLLLF